MGDPSGKKEDFPEAIEAFIEETDRLCYLPVFYETSEEIVMICMNSATISLRWGKKLM